MNILNVGGEVASVSDHRSKSDKSELIFMSGVAPSDATPTLRHTD